MSALILLAGADRCAAPKDAASEPDGPRMQNTPLAAESRKNPAARRYRNTESSYKVASSQAVRAYLLAPGYETLEKALETCLAARKKIPDDLLNNFLTAFCHHELGDAAAESLAMAQWRPEQKNLYRFAFYEHRDQLADALYVLPAYLCAKLREGSNAGETFLPGLQCPFFGTPVLQRRYRSGKKTMERFVCPKCDGMLQVQEEKFIGSPLPRAKKDNALNSVLVEVAVRLDDRRKFRSDKPGTVQKILDSLGIRKGQVVADIGSGIGQFTFPFAEKVGAGGMVYAEDIDESAIKAVKYCIAKEGIKNITPVLGTPTDVRLPAGAVDMAALIHVYRGISMGLDEKGPQYLDSFFKSFFDGIRKALKADGVLAIIDNTDPRFGLSAGAVAAAMEKRGFRLISDKSEPQQFTLFFKKSEPSGKSPAAMVVSPAR
ncbi:MAG: methyltransferase domain-containing protein [Elusimicrobia bacterium]|nr:methyltransferase domain-containing protein [Elusimicrobiota bacterium]